MRVVELRDGIAVAERNGVRRAVNALLLPDLQVGAWILALQQDAVRELDAQEAIDIEHALTAVAAILAGGADVDALLGDGSNREPALPAYLARHVARG